MPGFLKAWLHPPAAPDPVVKTGWKGVGYAAAVFVLAALVMGSIQFQQVWLVGADGYHHTRVARIISEQGILHEFPWTQASIFKNAYADKQFLFHALLIPFLGDDLVLGPKILTVLLVAMLLALLAWIALRHGFCLPWLWVTLVLAGGVMFLFRMSLTRPHLLAVPLAVLIAHCLLRRHLLGTFLTCLVFPLCYTAAHLPVGLVLVYAVACWIKRQKFPWQLLVAVVAGVALGLLLHPQRAHILQLWYLQNVAVVLNVWRIPDSVVMGTEFFSMDFEVVFLDTIILWIGLAAVGILFLIRRPAVSLRTVYLFGLAGAFFLMVLAIPRFVEYWVPFSVLFLASATTDGLAGFDWRVWLARHRVLGPALLGVGLLLLLVQTTRSVVESQIEVERDQSLHFREEARYIDRSLPDGELVFTCSWDSFPYLIHFAPRQRYLVALDPTFMQAYDAQLFQTWYRIANGEQADAFARVFLDFHARFVFAERKPWIEPFIRQALADRNFILVYNGPEAAVFLLAPDPLPWARGLIQAGLAALGQVGSVPVKS